MKVYFYALIVTFFITFLGILGIIYNISPEEFPVISPTVLYFLVFFMTFSLFTLIGYGIRRIIMPTMNKFFVLSISLRQAVLLSIFIVLSFIFMHMKIFSWLLMILIACALMLLEFFFIVKEDVIS